LAKSGSGTLVLGGANTYSAGTALNQGVLRFANGSLPHGASSIHFYGGTLQWASGNSQDISAGIAPVAAGQTAILDTNGNNLSFATGLSGSGGLTKAGSGGLTLTGANSYDGVTTISAGSLQLGNGTSGNDGSIAGSSIVDNAALVYNLSGSQAYSGAISGTGSLAKAGTGTLALTGDNSYSGITAINGGTLILAGTESYTGGAVVDAATLIVTSNAALADGTSLTVKAGGTLLFDPFAAQAPTGGAVVSGASSAAAVPEPGTLALAIAGLIAGFAARWRRKRMRDEG
jgi:autotransporter-associated beta strand protein